MARGDMLVKNTAIAADAEILNRKEFEAIAMTIDHTAVVKAGTPIKADGKPVTATPWTGAIGILLNDVDPAVNPQGTILKKAYIHKGRAAAHSGIAYDGKLPYVLNVMAGCRINFEEPYMAVVAL